MCDKICIYFINIVIINGRADRNVVVMNRRQAVSVVWLILASCLVASIVVDSSSGATVSAAASLNWLLRWWGCNYVLPRAGQLCPAELR